ncbi:hypothetical protein COOONC_09856 [Cooperia oncophora]
MLFTFIVLCSLLVNINADSGCVDYHGLSEYYIQRNRQFNPSLVWANDLASEACDVAKGEANVFAGHFKVEAEKKFPAGRKLPAKEMARQTLFRLKDSAYNVARMTSPRPEFGCNSHYKDNIMKVVCLYRDEE